MFSLFFEVFGKLQKRNDSEGGVLGERFVSSRFGHLVSALLVADWDEWDKRPAGSLRSIQFIQFNWTNWSGVKHGILWKFALFPTFVEKWVWQILSICWKMGLTNSLHLLKNGFDKFFTFVEFWGHFSKNPGGGPTKPWKLCIFLKIRFQNGS